MYSNFRLKAAKTLVVPSSSQELIRNEGKAVVSKLSPFNKLT
jgi:hypothetical protein